MTCMDRNINIDKRKRECGRLWKEADGLTKAKWKDPDFLETLPTILDTNTEEVSENDNSSPINRRKAPVSFNTERWASKVVVDMRKLSRRYGIEGFVVIGSRGKDGALKYDGGSHLGERFLDIYPAEDGPVTDFIDYIRGQKVSKKITGSELPLPKRRRPARSNRERFSPLLTRVARMTTSPSYAPSLTMLLSKPAMGKSPGVAWNNNSSHPEETRYCLASCRQQLQSHSTRLLVGRNWVRLIGPPAPRNEPVGLESDETNPQGTDVARVTIDVGKCKGKLQPMKTIIKRSKSTAGPPPLKKRKLDDTSHVETKRIPVIVDSTDEEDCDDEDYEEEEEQEEELEELERNLNDEEDADKDEDETTDIVHHISPHSTVPEAPQPEPYPSDSVDDVEMSNNPYNPDLANQSDVEASSDEEQGDQVRWVNLAQPTDDDQPQRIDPAIESHQEQYRLLMKEYNWT
ncbi:hypothetical protein H4Q26_008501 [Puccinia striiformis f. sp. tritici PST-130]|nr:hypothetical protein H4Q26_008501 [Puccinia striiformis f. sp. tritici PST-130]